VCQIVNRKEEHLREKELKVQEKKKAEEKIKRKDVELSWGISDHDLKTKMKQIGGFLQKGMRVEIVLGKKKRGKKISREDSMSVLTQVRENLEVLGARHVKAESGEVGELVRMTVEKK
jgi:translation initiation factor IF-3